MAESKQEVGAKLAQELETKTNINAPSNGFAEAIKVMNGNMGQKFIGGSVGCGDSDDEMDVEKMMREFSRSSAGTMSFTEQKKAGQEFTEDTGMINTCDPPKQKVTDDYYVKGTKVIPTNAPKILSAVEITPRTEKSGVSVIAEQRTGKAKPTMSSTFETVI